MPDILKYKSVAVPISTWRILKKLEKSTQRSPGKQIAFLVEIAKQIPTEKTLIINRLKEDYNVGV